MADRVFEVVQHPDVVAEVGAQELVAALVLLDVVDEDSGPLVEECAADDRLDDVLDSCVDGRYVPSESAERNRVNAFETSDLEHVLVGQVEPLMEPLDAGIGDYLRRIALATPGCSSQGTAAGIDGEASPWEQIVEATQLVVRKLLYEPGRGPAFVVALAESRSSEPADTWQ